MINGYIHGVQIECFENQTSFVLCLNCFRPLFDLLGGWKNIDLDKVHPLNDESYYRLCDVCGQSITVNRRSGADRRSYNYAVHIPERRKILRRKADAII
jgi:hypothetical protein